MRVIPSILAVALPWMTAAVALVTTGLPAGRIAAVLVLLAIASAGSGWALYLSQRAQRQSAHRALERLRAREAQARRLHGELDAELAQLRHQITDARTDARRERLRALGLAVELGIGDRRVPVRLRDLSLDGLFVELPRSEAERWCKGLPARVTLIHEGAPMVLGWATAEKALRLPKRGPPTWRLTWRQPLREAELPRAVWRATMDRDAHRVRPHPDARVVLHLDDTARPAILVDLSANGVGLTVALTLREAGRLPQRIQLTLHLPEEPNPITVWCDLRHIDARTAGTLLGLSFDPAATGFAEAQPRIATHVMRRDAHTAIKLLPPLQRATG